MYFFRKNESTHMGGAARFGQWSRLLQLIVVKFAVTKYMGLSSKAEWRDWNAAINKCRAHTVETAELEQLA